MSTAHPSALRVAAMAFTASADVRANAALVDRSIAEAAAAGARLLLTPECALVGYPGFARPDLEQVDWSAVASLEDELAEKALERGVVLILGTASPERSGIVNEALVCGAVEHELRYRKRCLTGHDRDHFVPGRGTVIVPVGGWLVGVAICFDLRFPDVWADLALAGADCFACIAHLAGPDPDPGTKATVLPAHCASRAAEFATPLLLCNTAADDRWCDSALWDARGVIGERCGAGLLTATIDHRLRYDPWYGAIRDQALARWRRRLREESPHW